MWCMPSLAYTWAMWALAVSSETSSVSPKYDVLGAAADDSAYETGENQYIGTDPNGIGGKIVVRVTYADGTIQDVEVLEQNETPEFGGAALEELPAKVVEANSTDIDGVTGATITSKAFFAAVQNAIAKA